MATTRRVDPGELHAIFVFPIVAAGRANFVIIFIIPPIVVTITIRIIIFILCHLHYQYDHYNREEKET